MIRISLRDLQWRRRRFVIVVFVASLAFGLALVMTGVTNQLTQEGENAIELFGADQWVVAAGVSGPFTSSQLIDATLGSTLAPEPGVTAASPILIGRTPIGPLDVNVVGYEPASAMLPKKLVDARARATDRGGAIADVRLGREVGDQIPLGGRSVPVVALIRDTSFFFGAPTVFLPLPLVQDLMFAGRDVASAIMIQGELDGIDAGPSARSLSIVTNDDVRSDFERVLKSSTDTIGIVDLLLWIMAAGIVSAIVYVSVLERTRDFATLKAMGTTNSALLFGLVVQGAVISLVSAVAAVAVCRVISPTFSFPVAVPPAAYVQLVAIALLVAVLASMAGVRRIAQIDPALAFGGAS